MSTAARKEAYQAIVARLPVKRARVYREIRAYGGTTINDGCRLTGWPYSTVSARFYELAEDGLIKDSGAKRDGQTVWVVAEPEERDALRAARRASKRVESKADRSLVVHRESGLVSVTLEFTLRPEDWARVKSTLPRVRFI